MVHGRKVVGQIHYRICAACAEGVVTGLDLDGHLHSTGIGTRALSHLRSRYPGTTWRSTLTLRTTRDLFRRMRIPAASADVVCAHARAGRDALQPTS
ncbi:N-acetyltransferase [Streptomyces sp. A1136]|nr:N-acetyltransferase [Streptomyces sp. A1136]